MRALALAFVVAVTALSGCLDLGKQGPQGDDPDVTPDPGSNGTSQGGGGPDGNPSGNGTGGNSSGGGNGTGGGAGNGTGSGSGNSTGNETENGTAPPEPVWPDINEARVRPGVQIVVQGAQCTSNFLFRSPVNGTVYIGLAAHCVYGQVAGVVAEVRDTVGGDAFSGPVAYSSWWDFGFDPPPDAQGGPSEVHPHDFALVAIPTENLGIVHPAVLHFGGPTALADFDTVQLGNAVLVFGNTGLRPGPQQLDWQEGYVLSKGSQNLQGETGHYVRAAVALPPLPGDSGSGLMTKAGKAIGALSVIGFEAPSTTPVYWEYSSVPHALSYLEARGWPLEVVTWDLLDDGNLPG